jgi:hypothetical protein
MVAYIACFGASYASYFILALVTTLTLPGQHILSLCVIVMDYLFWHIHISTSAISA